MTESGSVEATSEELRARGARMEAHIRQYFDACNAADVDALVASFVPDAVHYFPAGMYGGPFVGAEAIARRWADAVASFGSHWTVDRVLVDPESYQAVIEWTHFKRSAGVVLRGDEWYVFDPESGLIREIRAYYASPQDKSRTQLELGGYDYVGNGYPLEAPTVDGERGDV